MGESDHIKLVSKTVKRWRISRLIGAQKHFENILVADFKLTYRQPEVAGAVTPGFDDTGNEVYPWETFIG